MITIRPTKGHNIMIQTECECIDYCNPPVLESSTQMCLTLAQSLEETEQNAKQPLHNHRNNTVFRSVPQRVSHPLDTANLGDIVLLLVAHVWRYALQSLQCSASFI